MDPEVDKEDEAIQQRLDRERIPLIKTDSRKKAVVMEGQDAQQLSTQLAATAASFERQGALMQKPGWQSAASALAGLEIKAKKGVTIQVRRDSLDSKDSEEDDDVLTDDLSSVPLKGGVGTAAVGQKDGTASFGSPVEATNSTESGGSTGTGSTGGTGNRRSTRFKTVKEKLVDFAQKRNTRMSLLGRKSSRRQSTLVSGPQGADLIERNYNEKIIFIMKSDPENEECADCGDALGSDAWASLNLGIFLCIRCCGVHRSLGVHISQCRSVDLDEWTAEQVAGMAGNALSNKTYEAHIPLGRFRPSPQDPLCLVADWIKAKYASREFVEPQGLTSLASYALDWEQVQWTRNAKPKVARIRVAHGVLSLEAKSMGMSEGLVLSLDHNLQIRSRLDKAGGVQDRPVDSKVIQVVGVGGSTVLLEFEVDKFSRITAWLVALRGSATLGSRAVLQAGWLQSAGLGRAMTFRNREAWVVLHVSGLYELKGKEDPRKMPYVVPLGVGSGTRIIALRDTVRDVEVGVTRKRNWLRIKTDTDTHQYFGKDAADRDAWANAVTLWAGFQVREGAVELTDMEV